jgi:tyrosyl-tRNA synthetase
VAHGHDGADLVAVLVEVGVLTSKSEGRRLIAQGGLYVNDVAVVEGRVLEPADWSFGRYCMVRRGKKHRHLLVR